MVMTLTKAAAMISHVSHYRRSTASMALALGIDSLGLRVDRDAMRATASPQPPPEESPRNRIVGIVNLNMAIAVHADLLPNGERIRGGRQRQGPLLLVLKEGLSSSSVRCPMPTLSSDFTKPTSRSRRPSSMSVESLTAKKIRLM